MSDRRLGIGDFFRGVFMRRVGKWLIVGVCIIILGFVGLAVLLRFLFGPEVPSNIVDFHPTQFHAQTDAAFFFSVGEELKYSNVINPRVVTLLRGNINNFLVSPDGEKIAVIVKGMLLIVNADGSGVRQVVNVDSIYKEPKPIGRSFFRDDEFQWTNDSKRLYLIRDEYYASKGSQLYSAKGELWSYDLESGNLQLMLRPFPAYTYFLAGKYGIYFSVPTEVGDLRLRYFDGKTVRDIGNVNAWEVPKQELGSGESPFFSFSASDYNQLFARGAGLENGQNRTQKLILRDRSYLVFSEGQGMKGPFYCSNLHNSLFLPGGRYFLLNVECGNYEGQLLIDSKTGNYEPLPKDTRVYIALTTEDIPHYRISGGGIMAK
jgi:hypothetical protein